MRRYPPAAVFLAVATLYGCGAGSSNSSLTQNVRDAMASVPYQYRIDERSGAHSYVMFTAINSRQNLAVNFVYGLPNATGVCPVFPELPIPHRRGSKPAVAAEPESLICLEDDAWRRTDRYREAIVRRRILSEVAKALCEEVHSAGVCFL